MIQLPAVMHMKNQLKGTLALIFATVIWGSAFIAQSVGMDLIGPFTFQTVRCFLAVAFLFPLSYVFEKDRKNFMTKWRDPYLWKTGAICGLALFAAAGLQQMGLVHTTAGKSGFITAMYIVMVPILGLVLRRKPPISAWFSVAIAVAGLYLLSCVGVTEVNKGDIMTLGCAFFFAVQITLVDRLAGELDGIRLNCVQSFFCALFSAAVMIFTEEPVMANILQCWLPLGYAGILSMGVAYSLQIIGQKDLEPTVASLLMSLESVFAVVFAWLLLKEQMTAYELMGCGLVFGAVILSQLPAKEKNHANA